MPVYFQYPFNGNVYELNVDETELRIGRLVKLPRKGTVRVTVPVGYFPIVEDAPGPSKEKRLIARVAISEKDSYERRFRGNWETLIKLINIAAAVNTLFRIILTKKEYLRLKNGGLEEMKDRFSERAFSLLRLEKSYMLAKEPSLELFRTGHCR